MSCQHANTRRWLMSVIGVPCSAYTWYTVISYPNQPHGTQNPATSRNSMRRHSIDLRLPQCQLGSLNNTTGINNHHFKKAILIVKYTATFNTQLEAVPPSESSLRSPTLHTVRFLASPAFEEGGGRLLAHFRSAPASSNQLPTPTQLYPRRHRRHR